MQSPAHGNAGLCLTPVPTRLLQAYVHFFLKERGPGFTVSAFSPAHTTCRWAPASSCTIYRPFYAAEVSKRESVIQAPVSPHIPAAGELVCELQSTHPGAYVRTSYGDCGGAWAHRHHPTRGLNAAVN